MLRKLLMHPMQLKSTFVRSLSRKWNTLCSSLITTYLSDIITFTTFFKKKKRKKEMLIRRTKIKITSLLIMLVILSSYVISYIKSIIKLLEGRFQELLAPAR